MSPKDADEMANSVDPDQPTPLGAVWSGSALFAQAYLSENLGLLRYSIWPIIFRVEVGNDKTPGNMVLSVNKRTGILTNGDEVQRNRLS